MIDYKRLTKHKGEPLHTDMEVTDGDEIYERLAELEDMIEQGLLVKLPCKVGDTIYMPWQYQGQSDIAELTVSDIRIAPSTIFTNLESDDTTFLWKYNFGMFNFNELGKIVFLTKAEAEARLAELRGGK